jgi:hypothetical protein
MPATLEPTRDGWPGGSCGASGRALWAWVTSVERMITSTSGATGCMGASDRRNVDIDRVSSISTDLSRPTSVDLDTSV